MDLSVLLERTRPKDQLFRILRDLLVTVKTHEP